MIGLAFAGGLLLAGSGRGGAEERTLVLTGSSTVAPLAAEVGKRFAALHPGVRVDVHTGGSSRGVADARRGLADLGMASRALRADEADLVAYPIARDGIALIAHASNPVRGLTREQVRAIYRGEARSWAAFGGPRTGRIVVVHKAAGHSTHDLFLAHFGLREREVRADVVVGDNAQGIKAVAGNPLALGYVSIGAASTDAARGVPLRLLALDGVAPTIEAVRSDRYPLERPLNLVARGPARGLAAAFVAYARSEAVADLVTGLGFVPLTTQ
ncbi:MAG: phosphate ABC transporter substrate-binding protein [Planctomycetota bacterium]|nr:MAG: phosphate ABC transporter substrate-binding protein [Planctomycetota bacterium]